MHCFIVLNTCFNNLQRRNIDALEQLLRSEDDPKCRGDLAAAKAEYSQILHRTPVSFNSFLRTLLLVKSSINETPHLIQRAIYLPKEYANVSEVSIFPFSQDTDKNLTIIQLHH